MKTFCPYCGTVYLTDPDEDHVCICGIAWRDLAPFPRPTLVLQEWETITQMLLVRGGGMCELRSPACLAPRGDLVKLRDSNRVNRHHRLARHMGGTGNPAIHSLANLMLICGHGTIGCHGWIEHHGGAAAEEGMAYRNGYLIKHGVPGRWTADTDPAQVPLTLPSGRRVLLHPTSPEYIPIPYTLMTTR